MRTLRVTGLAVTSLLTAASVAGGTPGAAAATTGTWTQLSASTPRYGGGFADVSCSSATACDAVGLKVTLSATKGAPALVNRWDGTALRAQSDYAGAVGGVSCVTASFCMAVGYVTPSGTQAATAAVWNGTKWRTLTLPSRRFGDLRAVSCWSRYGCVAVGSYVPSTYARPLAERWNGTSWRAMSSPTGSAYANHLTGVSCRSRYFCLAVGQTFLDSHGRYSRTFSERWSGKSWVRLTTPTISKSYQPGLQSVSCVTARHCVAVGGADGHPMILLWNAGAFKRQTPGAPPAHTAPPLLTGVSCVTTSFCMATGTSAFPGNFQAEQWDGTNWTLVAIPGGTRTGVFDSMKISCPSTSMCLAAGSYQTSSGTERVVADRWSSN